MHQALAGRASLMPGAGVNADNVRTIIEFTGVNEVHMSGMGWRGGMVPHGVNMGTSDDGRVNITHGAKVAAVRALLAGPDTDRVAAWCLSSYVNMGTSDDGRVNITDGAKVAAVRALLDRA